jgi:hypothetical protein
MKTVNTLSLVLLIVAIFVQCNNSDSTKTVQGYLMVEEFPFYYFVPVNEMDGNNCVSSLNSGNLGKGLQFHPSKIPELSIVKQFLDTIRTSSGTLKLVAVEMKFRLNPEHESIYKDNSNEETRNLAESLQLPDRAVSFKFNVLPIQIDTVIPLNCDAGRKKQLVRCECRRDPADKFDYLFKVCKKIQEQDPFNQQACRYKVKSVTTTIHNNRSVIEVDFSYCRLGDVAFFDPVTKELISISYGAE